MILVDTTVWVDYFRGISSPEERALTRLIESGNELLCLTDIILTEILQGISSEAEYRKTLHFLERVPCLTAKAPATFLHAAELYRRCRKKGATVRSTVDCLIAAVCVENKASLLHHDADFQALARHAGLRVIDPAKI